MPLTQDELDVQDEFRAAIAAISWYQPELDLEIAKRIETDNDFFWATTHRGEPLLELALERRKNKMSTNLYIYGGGSIQVGKSVGGLLIALVEDPTWDATAQLMFDFAELDRKLPYTQRGKRYLLDDVRNRLVGTGAKAEIQRVQGFMETNGKNAISLTLVSPQFHELPALQYIIEVLGFCGEYSVAILCNRKNTPIAWLKFRTEAVPNFDTVYQLYDVEKQKFMLRMKLKGAGAGYISGKIAQMHHEITAQELEFTNKEELRDYIILNYDHWTQRVQDAAYRRLSRILELNKTSAVDVSTVTVREGQQFRAFLDETLSDATVRAIIRRYRKDDIPTMEDVGEQLKIGNHSQVNALLKPFREKLMGDLYEIWYNKGGEPAKEGEVDAWENGIPTNLKCTYRRYNFCRVDVDKMNPELTQAIEKGTKVRIRVFSLWHNQEYVQDFDPHEVLKRGVAQVAYT